MQMAGPLLNMMVPGGGTGGGAPATPPTPNQMKQNAESATGAVSVSTGHGDRTFINQPTTGGPSWMSAVTTGGTSNMLIYALLGVVGLFILFKILRR